MDRVCSTYGREEINVQNRGRKPQRKRPLERNRHRWENNNKRILNKLSVWMWTWLSWLRIRTSGRKFREGLRNWLGEWQFAPQKLCPIKPQTHYRGFNITLRHTTVGRTPLEEWSARCRDLYLTTHNTHNRQICMTPAGLEPTIPASERPQSHALRRIHT
jgi:hypothetical protein